MTFIGVLGEYEQNLCSGTSCQPCPSRLPSCVGIPDGDRPFPAHLWTDQYITCLSNRTIAVRHCPSGSVFDPARLQCVNRIEQGLLNLMICLLTPICLSNNLLLKESLNSDGQQFHQYQQSPLTLTQ